MGRTSGPLFSSQGIATPANPAAGADLVYVATAITELVAVRGQLVTSATAANRIPVLVVDDGAGHILLSSSANQAQAASLTELYVWSQGFTTGAPAGANNQPLPPIVLQVGWRVLTVTTALQAGDQWSAFVLTLQGR